MGGRGTVCLSHVVLGDYINIIHIFNNELDMGRNVSIVTMYIIHMFKMRCDNGMI